MTASEIADAISRSQSAVWRSLSALTQQGLVGQREQARPGTRPLVYYRMIDPLEALSTGQVQVPALLTPVEQLITGLAESRGMAPEELVVRALLDYLGGDQETRTSSPSAGAPPIAEAA